MELTDKNRPVWMRLTRRPRQVNAADPEPAEVAPEPDTYQQVAGEMPEGSVDAQQEANPLIRINANGEGPQALKPRGGLWLTRFTA